MRISHEKRKKIFQRAEIKLKKKLTPKRRCNNGSKIRYTTRKKALKALDKTRFIAMKEFRHAVQRVYLCPFCKGWHLTKQVQDSLPKDRRDAMLDKEPNET